MFIFYSICLGGDTVVSTSRCPLRCQNVFHLNWHVVSWLHICRWRITFLQEKCLSCCCYVPKRKSKNGKRTKSCRTNLFVTFFLAYFKINYLIFLHGSHPQMRVFIATAYLLQFIHNEWAETFHSASLIIITYRYFN